jgi:hypothetical protein
MLGFRRFDGGRDDPRHRTGGENQETTIQPQTTNRKSNHRSWGGLRCKSAVDGLNGQRLHYIISLFKVTYKSTIQVSRNFHALLQRPPTIPILAIDARLCLFHPRADEARVPPGSEQGLASAVNLARAFDHEFTQTPLAKHASFSGSLVAEVSSLCISSVCLITLDFPQPNRETARCEQSPKR